MLRITFTTFLFNISSLSINHSFESTPEPGTGSLEIVLEHHAPLLLDSSLQGSDIGGDVDKPLTPHLPRLNNQEVTNLETQEAITLLTSDLAGFLEAIYGSSGMHVELLHPAETQHCHLENSGHQSRV